MTGRYTLISRWNRLSEHIGLRVDSDASDRPVERESRSWWHNKESSFDGQVLLIFSVLAPSHTLIDESEDAIEETSLISNSLFLRVK